VAPAELDLRSTELETEHATNSLSLAGALRQRLATASFASMLGPKVSVVIDGGATLHLDAVAADIRLRACPASAGWHVGLGGDAAGATPIGSVAPADAAEVVMRLLEQLARHGPQVRARDLIQRHGPEAFRSAIADLLIEGPSPAPRPPSDPIGTHPLRDPGVALGIALAFGHTHADAMASLIEAARRAGASGLRPAPGRALRVIGLAANASPALAARADDLGFITRREDPRRSVVACAGAPICASAEIPARALAPAITIVGSRDGCGLVVDGSARDHPATSIAAAALPAGLERIAREVAGIRRPGEASADTLVRLGAAQVATIFESDPHE
jgi:precorrin-3B synthase